MRRPLLCLMVLAAVMAGNPAIVSAHSFPERETPAAGQSLGAAPAAIVIRYDAPIEKLFASLQVIGPDGKNAAIGAPDVSADGYTLSIKLGAMKPGTYKVKWSVVCADTHHTEGSYTFTLAGKPI